jgi:hypothetical protein
VPTAKCKTISFSVFGSSDLFALNLYVNKAFFEKNSLAAAGYSLAINNRDVGTVNCRAVIGGCNLVIGSCKAAIMSCKAAIGSCKAAFMSCKTAFVPCKTVIYKIYCRK